LSLYNEKKDMLQGITNRHLELVTNTAGAPMALHFVG